MVRDWVQRHPFQVVAWAVASILVLGIIVILAAGTRADQEHRSRMIERLAAEQRWSQSNITDYVLEIQENGCRYSAIVQNDVASVDTLSGSCTMQPSTVPALFRVAARDGQRERLCDTQGCPCESSVDVIAGYAEHGYPQRLVITVELRPAWFAADFWQHLSRQRAMPPCLQSNTSEIEVVSLVPR